MMIFGASEVSRNVDLGDETTTMMCKFVVRASEASITKQIESDIQGWCDDLTDGGVEYMPEDEVKATAAEKLKISMERIALLKAAQPKKTPKTEEETEEEEEEEEKEEDEEEEEKKDKDEGNDKEEKKKKKKKEKEKGTFSKLTAEETEHMALQAAVLQEWHMLCKDRKYTKVN